MAQWITAYMRVLLAVVLAVGIIVSANSRSVTHDFTELAKIVSEHHAEIEEHGHAHEDLTDLMHAFHGHHHEINDHDHNIAFLPPRAATDATFPNSTGLAMPDYGRPDRIEYGLDRPPRV